MIEQAMIFALGVCVAGLLALLCLPAISRRAMRLAQSAVERQMPLSVDEVVAQRDLLRAEFAADRRRVEQALERAKESGARAMSDAGRRAATIGRLTEELADAVRATHAADEARNAAERLCRETEAENVTLQKVLYDSADGEDRWREHHAVAAREIAGLREELATSVRIIAALEAARESDAATRRGLERDATQMKLDLSVARTRAEALAAQVEGHEDAIRNALAGESDLRRTLAEAVGESGELALLRQTVAEIGAEVVRMARDAQRPTLEMADGDARAGLH